MWYYKIEEYYNTRIHIEVGDFKMNEIKYLNEFDKVLFSLEESKVEITEARIAYAHKRLYQEVFLRGNIVVFTYNQVIDSLAFLRLVEDSATLENIIKLFEMGRLKMSLSNSTHKAYSSASHFVQDHLSSYSGTPSGDDSIFSSMDIDFSDKTLIKDFQNALKYSSNSVFDNYLDNSQGSQIPFLKNYVKLITSMSMNQIVGNNANKNLNDLIYYIDKAKISLEKRHPNIVEIISLIESKFENGSKKKSKEAKGDSPINTRSFWYSEIDAITPNRELSKKCKRFIDICYNYCLNDNIDGISLGYANSKTFTSDFVADMNLAYDSSMRDLPVANWELAVNIFQTTPFHAIEKSDDDKIWKTYLRKVKYMNLLASLLVSVAFVTVIALIDLAVSFATRFIPEDVLNTIDPFRMVILYLINIILFVIVFIVFNKIISKRRKSHDISTSFKKMFLNCKALRAIRKSK